jgi:hypothetical protein
MQLMAVIDVGSVDSIDGILSGGNGGNDVGLLVKLRHLV